MTGLCCFSFVSPGREVFEKNVPNFRTLAIWCCREVFPAKNLLRNLHYLDWRKCSLLGGPSSGSNNFVVRAVFCHMQPGSVRYHGHLSSWHFLNPTAPRASAQCAQLSTADFCFPAGARFTSFNGTERSLQRVSVTQWWPDEKKIRWQTIHSGQVREAVSFDVCLEILLGRNDDVCVKLGSTRSLHNGQKGGSNVGNMKFKRNRNQQQLLSQFQWGQGPGAFCNSCCIWSCCRTGTHVSCREVDSTFTGVPTIITMFIQVHHRQIWMREKTKWERRPKTPRPRMCTAIV